MWWSPNKEAFQPPNEWNAIGTGIGTLMANHADLKLMCELCRIAVPGEYRCAVAKFVLIDHFGRSIV